MEPLASSSPTPAKGTPYSRNAIHSKEVILSKLNHIYALCGDHKLEALIEEFETSGPAPDEIQNRLMAIFRDHALVEAYSFLYELSYKQFTLIIFNKLKYYCHLLDTRDILQDVFLSIYRYPHKFRDEKKYAFRNWSYTIIRNTILKHLKMRNTHESSSDSVIEIIEDKKKDRPLNNLVNKESIGNFKRLYLLYLVLYLNVVNNFLAERERLALHLVEVEGKRYREASSILGIKLENFKMVVCRARKKIVKRMNEILGADEQ